ncbi:hypothetical protein [Vibrio sp. 10N]|uniref:hypothetical protein n=1 Tax=Vibrio sp. 10N TaxID=3058938 RepID=UPI002812FC66|nr:hypothetical protein VB10N_43670 [Vibrio sp. 10N]
MLSGAETKQVNIYQLLYIAIVASPLAANASWFNEHNIDKFDRIETHRVWGFGDLVENKFTTYGIRCDDRSKLLVTFGLAQELDEENAKIDLAFKVDNNKPLFFEGQLFSNSKESGFVRADKQNLALINRLILQSKQGKTIDIRASNKDQSQFIEYSVSLSGFTKFSHATRDACGVGTMKLAITPKDKAALIRLKQQLKDIEKQIAEIEAKYSAGF